MMARKGKHGSERDQHWRQMITKWHQSGLSAAAFCRLHQIPQSTFHSRIKILARKDQKQNLIHTNFTQDEQATFVPVCVSSEDTSKIDVVAELSFIGGQLRLFSNADILIWQMLLQALKN
jgi:hypothetical protein